MESSECNLECNDLELSDSEQDEDESIQLEEDVSHYSALDNIVPLNCILIYRPRRYGLMSQTQKMIHNIVVQ